MTREEKRNAIVKYLVSCGAIESKAIERAEELSKSDSCSLFARKFNEETMAWSEPGFIENFSCAMEYYGWKKDHSSDLESKGYREILFLDANDPFYNSAWGMIPDGCLASCCEPVRVRAARGM